MGTTTARVASITSPFAPPWAGHTRSDAAEHAAEPVSGAATRVYDTISRCENVAVIFFFFSGYVSPGRPPPRCHWRARLALGRALRLKKSFPWLAPGHALVVPSARVPRDGAGILGV